MSIEPTLSDAREIGTSIRIINRAIVIFLISECK
jgi:hypothetical protein